MRFSKWFMRLALIAAILGATACSTDRNINAAKLKATEYWTDKAYPGKAYDVRVLDAVKVDNGKYRVKAMVDGDERVGLYDPKTETFDEGYYTLAYSRGKRIAELVEENRYLKDQVQKKNREIFQLKLRLKYVHAGRGDPNMVVDPNTNVGASNEDVQPVASKKAKTPAAAASGQPVQKPSQ